MSTCVDSIENKLAGEQPPISNSGTKQFGRSQPAANLLGKGTGQCPSTDAATQNRIRDSLSRRELARRWHVCPHTIARRKDLRPVRLNQRLIRYWLDEILAIEAAAQP
ncbi:MAG: hypothetical protein WCO56_19070 [Verrucomicrobiota bacterium]